MSGIRLGIGVGIKYAHPIFKKKGGGQPFDESCFSTGVWIMGNPWKFNRYWKMTSVVAISEEETEQNK